MQQDDEEEEEEDDEEEEDKKPVLKVIMCNLEHALVLLLLENIFMTFCLYMPHKGMHES